MSKVAVFGDIILDKYVNGDSNRISPEAPIPVLNHTNTIYKLGGAANVSLNLQKLGIPIKLYGIIGSDTNAEIIETLLLQHGIEYEFVRSESFPTITKVRFLSNNHQILRLDYEKHFCGEEVKKISEKLNDSINQFSCLVISDYDKGTYNSSFISFQNIKSLNSQIEIFVDPKSSNLDDYMYADFITPNLSELKKLVSKSALNESIAKEICLKFHIRSVLLTKSEDGMELYQDGSLIKSIPAILRDVIDVTGAGDTVVATFIASLYKGYELVEALALANIAASLACSKVGTFAPTWKEVIENSDFDSKVVFTNGCFDILHLGHLKFLKKAKSLGNKLIVGLNSDSSIKILKGPGRPLNNQKYRSEMLLALGFVDEVIIFDEETPLNLIKQLRPDLLVKGGDYSPSEIVGYDFVMSYGGEVKTLDLVSGISTSKIIASIKENEL